MEIITSHNALDFDGLASMVGASKIYPGAVMVISGSVPKKIKQFMALYKDSLMIKTPKEIDLRQVTRVIVVDTASPQRLGQLKAVTNIPNIDFHIYDHHPPAPDDIKGSLRVIEPLGAATTLIVEEIIDRNLDISPFEATILALGIYEDTGSLVFPSTTERDARAVAFLLSRRANLEVVARFMETSMSVEQRQVLQELLESMQHYRIDDIDIVIAAYNGKAFVAGLDLVTYRLSTMEECDAIFVVAFMQGRVYIIGRSATSNLRVNEVLQPLGGNGHDRAASAIIKGKECPEVVELILENVKIRIRPAIIARDIMSTPVKTMDMYRTMEDAGRIMLRYGHTGMPVVDGEKVVGMISRRDVDKAIMHELGHAPVKGFMTTGVISISPETPVSEVQKMVVEYDIGRLPVVERGNLIGIVSRTDILRILHGDDYPEDHAVLYSYSEGGTENYHDLMQNKLPTDIFSFLEIAGQIAQEQGSTVYCVGGFVRDLFLNVPNFDVDLVVEGDGHQLAMGLAAKLGGKVRVHERFGTAVVFLGEGIKIDVATARREYYEFPAALPMVEQSSIKEDLYRRDFTINTLALCLNPDKHGDLIDYFGGRKDIQNGYIRILYNLSFVEDPTRILRAIRFEQRYKFTIEKDTLRLAIDAIERRMLGKLSYKRIMHELILILSEKDPISALERMKETGVWKYILPEIRGEEVSQVRLRRISIVIAWWEDRYYGREIKTWLVYLLAIFAHLTPPQLEAVLNRYPLDKYARSCIEKSIQVPKLAHTISQNPELRSSQLDKMLLNLETENILYLLLYIKEESVWEKIVHFYDLKEQVKLAINGHDLKDLGLKPGPLYKVVLEELYYCKLDGIVNGREEELNLVRQWITEGRFTNGVVN